MGRRSLVAMAAVTLVLAGGVAWFLGRGSPPRDAASPPGPARPTSAAPAVPPAAPPPAEPPPNEAAASVPVIRGRALAADGSPLAAVRLSGRFASPQGPRLPGDLAGLTGADGRFRLLFTAAAALRSAMGHQEFPGFGLELDARPEDENRVPRWSARAAIPGIPWEGTLDVGDVRFEAVTVIAAGVVKDETSAVVPNAFVTLWFLDARNGTWLTWPRYGARTDGSGRFVLPGDWPGGPARITGVAAGYLESAPVAVESAGTLVGIVLARESVIEGRILLDPAVAPAGVRVEVCGPPAYVWDRLEPSKTPPEAAVRAVDGLGQDGGFVVPGLRAGRATVVVRLIDGGREFGRVEGLAITDGQTCRDARLDPLDLRGRPLPSGAGRSPR